MKDGFLKAAALSPSLRVADCNYNASQIVSQLQDAAARGVRLAVFPEFCLTGYTCGDLFLQRTLQQGALDALQTVLDASRELDVVALVGLPLLVRGKLYNCAAVLCSGRLLGLVPKTYLPNYGEFYEKRQFTPGSTEVETVTVCGQEVPFGTSLLFRCRQMPSFVLGVEICEDLWSALPPSTFHTLAGATVIANLSASDETVGKAEYRRALVSNQSARLLCGYLYASAGHGESTQDMVFAGHDLIAENGALLAETSPFEGGWAETELDCQRMESERARNTSFEPSAEGYLTVDFDLALTETKLSRWVDPTPFIPHDERRRAERCELILKMQADGLAKRLEHAHAKTAVIGISGGLDSCLALLVAVRAMKQLGRPTSDVLAVTMPCFGTTHRTRSNAEILCDELAVSFTEIDIANTVHSHFKDIGQDESVLDVTFENGQARVRTLELMDTANRTGGLVVGTGDLSELALGWATYNGDHMSMYGVNAGVPKTLVRHLVKWAAATEQDAATRALRNGMTLHKLLSQLEGIRNDVKIPLILMGYINPIMQYGFEALCSKCADIGIDGLIIPDLPYDEYMKSYRGTARKYGLEMIMLITPETEDERIRLIDSDSDGGFIYMVSSAATTGAQKDFDNRKREYFSRIKNMNLRRPRMIGFGVSNAATYNAAAEHASGVIIGSRFVTLLNEEKDAGRAIGRLLKDIGRV